MLDFKFIFVIDSSRLGLSQRQTFWYAGEGAAPWIIRLTIMRLSYFQGPNLICSLVILVCILTMDCSLVN